MRSAGSPGGTSDDYCTKAAVAVAAVALAVAAGPAVAAAGPAVLAVVELPGDE